MRTTSNTDFDLPNVILTRTDVIIKVHCTKDMVLILNNKSRSCSINNQIEIPNITDFELQNVNKTSKISAHTIPQDWSDTIDNEFNSETDLLDRPDILTSNHKETMMTNFRNFFILKDGKPHTANILTVSGTTIIIITLSITGLVCFWRKNPTCANNLLANCHETCKRTKERKKTILVDYILTTIQNELNSNIQGASTDRAHTNVPPPSPPDIQM